MKLDLKLKRIYWISYKQKHENQYKCSLKFQERNDFLHIKYTIKYFFSSEKQQYNTVQYGKKQAVLENKQMFL